MFVCGMKGGQRGFEGHVANVAQNVKAFATSLPRLAAGLPVLIVRRHGTEPDTYKYFFARRGRVEGALRRLRLNNPKYIQAQTLAMAVTDAMAVTYLSKERRAQR